MEAVDQTPGPLGDSAPDTALLNGQPHSGWFARLRQFWTAHRSHAPSAANSTPASLTSPDLTAFVLLGGGSRGAAQAGAIAAVMEHGVRPDVIIGVSAGAWNGAYLAVDPTPERARALCDIWAGLRNSDLLGGGWWRAAVSAVSGRASLYSAAGPLGVADRYMEKHTFEDLKIPLHILATNLTTAQPMLFSSGRLLPAVLASSAVPGVFPPMVIEGQVYVDGGLLEWDACAAALRLGAQKIYLIGCGAVGELSPKMSGPPGAAEAARRKLSNGRAALAASSGEPDLARTVGANLLEVLERSWDVVSRYQFRRAVEELRAGGAHVVSIEPLLPLLSRALDFNRSGVMIASGRAAAEIALKASAEEDAASNSVPLAPHSLAS
ncbi:MAG TPA: patatin-like phospholipase family protein [Ktedonobacterales bacterium]|nr:patatin-like phospholipase family protein [Ktedonobacterales bacterium]